MTETLTLRFVVDGWDPAELPGIDGDWAGAVTMHKTYSGTLTGTSVAHFVSSGDEEHGRAYLAAERITGTLDDGRSGSVTIYHGAVNDPSDTTAFAYIVPGTGTGDFAGFTGTGRIEHDEQGPSFVLTLG